ncbi:MAG: hypothetical protein LW698_07615 [Planctomycetaceae bacterium]|nr:hypothetical protein [Planctomycetaceae bacterium]
MDIAAQLSLLLGLAWLAPLASFVAILFFGPRMGKHGRNAAWVATAAIVTSLVLRRPWGGACRRSCRRRWPCRRTRE